jgi:AcrR family transcriptional regulator
VSLTSVPARRSRRTVRPERADVRERILDAGRAVFAEVGYQKATLDAIAGRAGFSKGAVYSNFTGKDDLFLTLLQDEVAGMVDALAVGAADGSLDDDLRLLARAVVEWARDGRAQLLFAEFRAHAAHEQSLARRTAEVRASLVATTATQLEAVVTARGGRLVVDPEDAATMLLALVNGLALEQVGRRGPVVTVQSVTTLLAGLVVR